MKTGKQMAEQLAQSLISVQPMPDNLLKDALNAPYLSNTELVNQGFKPVSRFGLLWVKDENKGN